MTPRQPYAITSRVFLLAAQDLLAQDDLLQAPEKGWGAAAQMVKAVADQKGWQHNGHAYLFRTLRQLVEETKDNQIDTLFHVANHLHVNFYENIMDRELVEVGLVSVRELVEKLEQLLR
jgi:Archaeal PaREP1/PaREP8 family